MPTNDSRLRCEIKHPQNFICLSVTPAMTTRRACVTNNLFTLNLISELDEVGTGTTDELEEEPSASQMAGKSPNFCVLLHGSLKVEGMVAVVQLGWGAAELLIYNVWILQSNCTHEERA